MNTYVEMKESKELDIKDAVHELDCRIQKVETMFNMILLDYFRSTETSPYPYLESRKKERAGMLAEITSDLLDNMKDQFTELRGLLSATETNVASDKELA